MNYLLEKILNVKLTDTNLIVIIVALLIIFLVYEFLLLQEKYTNLMKNTKKNTEMPTINTQKNDKLNEHMNPIKLGEVNMDLINEKIIPTKLPEVNIYSKNEEIMYPSSVDDIYVGRDSVCFRSQLGNFNYMKNRNGCLACQVDKRKTGQNTNYDGTKTNVISTCLYSTSKNPSDPTVWTKKECVDKCSVMEDKN
jgi:hypothetical protein